MYYPGQKKRTIPEIRGEKNAVPSCDIMLDDARSALGKSCGQSRMTLPCVDRASSSTISQDRAAFFSPRISGMVLFFVQGSISPGLVKRILRYGLCTTSYEFVHAYYTCWRFLPCMPLLKDVAVFSQLSSLITESCFFSSRPCTAWDSEIESLTSLIKLHQNERSSAPCGQIGAATQPPVLATSPTLKKFWVARAFEVRWACTCCHDRTGFNYCLLPLSHFSTFFVFSLGALHNPESSLNSRVLSTPASSNVLMTWRCSSSL